jgi:hypothetical protein
MTVPYKEGVEVRTMHHQQHTHNEYPSTVLRGLNTIKPLTPNGNYIYHMILVLNNDAVSHRVCVGFVWTSEKQRSFP